MAFVSETNNNSNTNTNGKKKADGWLNITITDANGNDHRLRVGVPLNVDNQLDRSLINAAKANPDIEITNIKANITVARSDEELSKDIPLF